MEWFKSQYYSEFLEEQVRLIDRYNQKDDLVRNDYVEL